jgi:hypothetical protein
MMLRLCSLIVVKSIDNSTPMDDVEAVQVRETIRNLYDQFHIIDSAHVFVRQATLPVVIDFVFIILIRVGGILQSGGQYRVE